LDGVGRGFPRTRSGNEYGNGWERLGTGQRIRTKTDRVMPNPCRACSHPDRAGIDSKLTAGGSVRDVAALFGLSHSAVGRHRVRHLADAREPSASRETEQNRDVETPIPETHPGPAQEAGQDATARHYRCYGFPNLRLGDHIRFEDARFATADPDLQRILDAREYRQQFRIREVEAGRRW
jgi:hypothetical protein